MGESSVDGWCSNKNKNHLRLWMVVVVVPIEQGCELLSSLSYEHVWGNGKVRTRVVKLKCPSAVLEE